MKNKKKKKVKVPSYIKTNTVFGLSKYSCIRIEKNILKINTLFFYENQKFRPFVIYFRNFRGFQR